MFSLSTILSIAKFESKTLFRSWFFRIFAGLILVMLFMIDLGMYTTVGFPQWDVIAVPSNLPYSNFQILNFVQAIIAVFLAADFLRRDKKLDTTEVIYMRSMSNADYVIGKTLGNLYVFFVLNLIAASMALIFNALLADVPILVLPYIYYVLLISLPTLLFILGLSFLLMSLIKNQALTFVILLGYIGANVFYLQTKFFYLLDYMGYKIPMVYSALTGFGDLDGLLLQRGMFILLGLSFISGTIALLGRLPQKSYEKPMFSVFFVLFLAGAGYLGFDYYTDFTNEIALREAILERNDKYHDEPLVAVQAYDLNVEHQGNEIFVEAKLDVRNEQKEPLSTLVFSLNPGLVVETFNEGTVRREQNLLFLDLDKKIAPGRRASVELTYKGKIAEWACFPEIVPEQFYESKPVGFGSMKRRYAFIEPNIVTLTRESEWYPIPGVGIGASTWGNGKQFSTYNLSVKTTDSLSVVSQGDLKVDDQNIYHFTSKVPLPQISLAIADYEHRSIEVDGISMELNYVKGHNYFDSYFENLGDTLEYVLQEQLNDYERELDIRYPYKYFRVVETPGQFNSYERVISSERSQVQPQMVFFPEKGTTVSGLNLMTEKRREKYRNSDQKNQTPQEIEINRLQRLIQGTFLQESERPSRPAINISFGGGSRFSFTESSSPYYVFPNFYNYTNTVESEKYPIMNRVMESYLKSTTSSGDDRRANFMRTMTGSSENEEGNIELQTKSLKQLLSYIEEPALLDNVVDLKGKYLFSILETGEEEGVFPGYIRDLLLDYRGRNLSIADFDRSLKENYNVELSPMLEEWYNVKALPGYIIQNIFAERVVEDESKVVKVSLDIMNQGTVDGVVKLSFMFGGGRRGGPGGGGQDESSVTKLISLTPHEAKHVSFILTEDPRMLSIDTYCSMNVPSTISHRFEKIEFNENGTAVEEVLALEASAFDLPEYEIIVDNEDQGFSLVQPEVESPLKKLLSTPDPDESKYKGMSYWSTPEVWTFTTNSDFYGDLIRSAAYVKGGDGTRIASWKPKLEKAGYYDISIYIPGVLKSSMGRGRRGSRGGSSKSGELHYTITSDDGVEEIPLAIKDLDVGWYSLGAFYLSPSGAEVRLNNSGTENMVIADAVKFTLDVE